MGRDPREPRSTHAAAHMLAWGSLPARRADDCVAATEGAASLRCRGRTSSRYPHGACDSTSR